MCVYTYDSPRLPLDYLPKAISTLSETRFLVRNLEVASEPQGAPCQRLQSTRIKGGHVVPGFYRSLGSELRSSALCNKSPPQFLWWKPANEVGVEDKELQKTFSQLPHSEKMNDGLQVGTKYTPLPTPSSLTLGILCSAFDKWSKLSIYIQPHSLCRGSK